MVFDVYGIDEIINNQINKHKRAVQDEARLILYENEDSLYKNMEMINKKSFVKFIKRMKKALLRRIRRIYETI